MAVLIESSLTFNVTFSFSFSFGVFSAAVSALSGISPFSWVSGVSVFSVVCVVSAFSVVPVVSEISVWFCGFSKSGSGRSSVSLLSS